MPAIGQDLLRQLPSEQFESARQPALSARHGGARDRKAPQGKDQVGS